MNVKLSLGSAKEAPTLLLIYQCKGLLEGFTFYLER